MAKPKKEELHPAQGIAQFSRASSNGGVLFGSQLEHHYTIYRLTISGGLAIQREGEPETYLDEDVKISVDFSADQFAHLITNMNVKPGTPCTIRRLNHKAVEPLPERPTNMSRIRDDFKKQLSRLIKELESSEQEMSSIVAEGKPLGKAKQRSILMLFRKFRQEIESNIPFTLDMFHEATVNTVNHAKQEVHSTMQLVLEQAGLQAVQNRLIAPTLTELQITDSGGSSSGAGGGNVLDSGADSTSSSSST